MTSLCMHFRTANIFPLLCIASATSSFHHQESFCLCGPFFQPQTSSVIPMHIVFIQSHDSFTPASAGLCSTLTLSFSRNVFLTSSSYSFHIFICGVYIFLLLTASFNSNSPISSRCWLAHCFSHTALTFFTNFWSTFLIWM